jgi:hypothetical protein
MTKTFAITFLALAFTATWAATPEYSREVKRWQEVAIPRENDEYRLTAWFSAASFFSKAYEWRVFIDRGEILAQLASEPHQDTRERPTFQPEVDIFVARPETAVQRVNDGWLVGFNDGEWGGALYWFSLDGKRNYKISDHRVVDFFTGLDGVYAIEGLAHMDYVRGAVIRIARADPDDHWRASIVANVPDAPCTVSVRRDGTAFITTPSSIDALSRDGKLTTLLQDPWWYRPTSSVLSPDEQKLYLGMWYFVAEFEISTKKLRLLVPSNAFLEPFRISEQRMRDEESQNNMLFYRRPKRK